MGARHSNASVEFSVVIPVFNEEGNLEPLHTRLTKVMLDLQKPYEIIFVDDGSNDTSFQILKSLHQKDKNIKVIRFTRNFGQHIAITAGLDCCKGKFVILIDADMQHPPEEIPKLLTKLREGYDIVYGIPQKRRDTLFKRLTSKIYLGLLAKLTNQAINPEIGAFRAMQRRVVDYFVMFRERNRLYGGLIAWLGFTYTAIEVEHDRRLAGKSKYNLPKLVRHAIEGVISFSATPLQLAGYLGLTVSGLSFALGIYMLVRWFIWGVPVAGYTSLIVSTFFLGGIVLIFLWVIGQYIGRIHIEVKQRPLYVIRDKIE